jgi:hypothetical protein
MEIAAGTIVVAIATTQGSRPVFQLCKKIGHALLRCYKSFGIILMPRWRPGTCDFAATDHITADLDNPTTPSIGSTVKIRVHTVPPMVLVWLLVIEVMPLLLTFARSHQ